MKSFVKFLVTLIVIALVGFVAYYLVINGGPQDNDELPDIDVIDDNSGDMSNSSGEFSPAISGDMFLPDHGEPSYPEVTIDPIEQIEEKVQEIESGEIVSTLREKLEPEVIGESARDFLNYFNQTDLSVTINLKKGMIEIIPDIDFLENQIFYFDEEGNLILYKSVSNTVEGVSEYYFDRKENIKLVNEYEEGVTPTNENITEILNRAEKLYEKYAIK